MQNVRNFRSNSSAALVLACAALGSFGCSSHEADETASTRSITQLTPELAQVVAANQQLTWALYQRIVAASPNDNAFFSPFSIGAALSMAELGARGDTLSEMQAVLGIPADDAAYHRNFGALLADLDGEHAGRAYQLAAANGAFVDAGVELEPDFLGALASNYDAHPVVLPFGSDPESARSDVNQWVADETHATIPELFPSGTIDATTAFVLASAIYFDAPWANGFDPSRTAPGTFHAPAGDRSVPMMTNASSFPLLLQKDLTLAELDYRDHELSLIVVQPTALDGLPALEATLTTDSVNALIDELPAPVDSGVTMPRFELRAEISLESTLAGLGMPSAFDPAHADFTGISSAGDLSLAHVPHAAYLQVDETGTVASAATGAAFERHGAEALLTLDHPFLFFIRDKLTGAILFAGRVLDPS